MYVYYNIEARSRNHCCSGKAIGVIYSKCVSVSLVIQHAKPLRPIVSVVCPALRYFPYYLINGTIIEKKDIQHKRRVFFLFFLQILSETFLILRKNGRDIIINAHRAACKVPFILVRF